MTQQQLTSQLDTMSRRLGKRITDSSKRITDSSKRTNKRITDSIKRTNKRITDSSKRTDKRLGAIETLLKQLVRQQAS